VALKASHLPNAIFAIRYLPSPTLTEFKRHKEMNGSSFAFHGSKLPNFHSILYNGLDETFAVNQVFGKGNYLSTTPQVCQMFMQYGEIKYGGRLGDVVGCMVCCEVAKTKGVEFGETKGFSASHSLPDTYVLSQGRNTMLEKYILVFGRKVKGGKRGTHICYVLLILYILLMVFIGGGFKRFYS